MDDNKNNPKTVDEAVDILLEELEEEVLNQVRDATSLIEFHFGLGMYIRNRFVYGSEYKDELIKDAFSRNDFSDDNPERRFIIHIDDVSGLIIEELQKRLREDESRN